MFYFENDESDTQHNNLHKSNATHFHASSHRSEILKFKNVDVENVGHGHGA